MGRAGTPEELEVRAAAMRDAQAAQTALDAANANQRVAQAARNEAARIAYERGANITELGVVLGMSAEAVSKAIGRPQGHRRGRPATATT